LAKHYKCNVSYFSKSNRKFSYCSFSSLIGNLDYCIQENNIPMVWSPLGGGSINNVEDERNKRINAVAISLQKI
jgi:predicted oxidoreductase